MRVLMVSSEVWPHAKVGGLADAVGSLSGCLASMGHDVRCAVPMYRSLRRALPEGARESWRRAVPLAGKVDRGEAELVLVNGAGPYPLVLVDHPVFRRDGIYDDPSTRAGYPDNEVRWALFCRALHGGLGRDGWTPEVIHAHDHQAATLLALLRWGTVPGVPALVYTIHNLGYQGIADPSWMDDSGLPAALFGPMGPLEFHGRVNLMKAGIEAADRLTTVSPSYAGEILGPEQGCGLEGVLSGRSSRLSGILNGIDTATWNPEGDPHIARNYSARNRKAKNENRAALREELGLDTPDEDIPIVGMISRLTSQKGIDLLIGILDRMIGAGVQVAILGSGEERFETALREIAFRHGGSMALRIGFDEALAHRIEAGSDIYLMPSRYEPCGLNQMYSLRYGTVPVVRAVGGLADTVFDPDEHPDRANGFVFRMWHSMELFKTVMRAAGAWKQRRFWGKLMGRGMAADFSWEGSANHYLEVYRRAAEDRTPVGV
jgi:starch synthase